MNIYSKNIYEVIINSQKKHVLIIYNISDNHYIGLTCHNTKSNNYIYIDSINKYVDIEDLKEYSQKNIKRFSLQQRYIFKNY